MELLSVARFLAPSASSGSVQRTVRLFMDTIVNQRLIKEEREITIVLVSLENEVSESSWE